MARYTIEDLYRMQKYLIAHQDGTLAQGAPVISAQPSQLRLVKNKKKAKAGVDNCKLSDMEEVHQPHKLQSMKSKKRAEKRRAERVSNNIGKELLEKYPIETFDFTGQKTVRSRRVSPEPTQDAFHFVVPSETFTFATSINDGNFANALSEEPFVGFMPVSDLLAQLSVDDAESQRPQSTSFSHRKIAVPKSRRKTSSSIPAEIDAVIIKEHSALDNGTQAPVENVTDSQQLPTLYRVMEVSAEPIPTPIELHVDNTDNGTITAGIHICEDELNALDLELETGTPTAQREGCADSVQGTVTETSSSDSSCGELTLYDVSRQGSPETSATLLSSLETNGSAGRSGSASFDILMQASHLQIGTVAYTDFVEMLVNIGYAPFTKEDIAATFIKLSSEEREDLGLEPQNLSGKAEDILQSRMLLKKVKIGNIKLHDFLNMVEFSEGLATAKDVGAAFKRASEKERETWSRIGPLIRF